MTTAITPTPDQLKLAVVAIEEASKPLSDELSKCRKVCVNASSALRELLAKDDRVNIPEWLIEESLSAERRYSALRDQLDVLDVQHRQAVMAWVNALH